MSLATYESTLMWFICIVTFSLWSQHILLSILNSNTICLTFLYLPKCILFFVVFIYIKFFFYLFCHQEPSSERPFTKYSYVVPNFYDVIFTELTALFLINYTDIVMLKYILKLENWNIIKVKCLNWVYCNAVIFLRTITILQMCSSLTVWRILLYPYIRNIIFPCLFILKFLDDRHGFVAGISGPIPDMDRNFIFCLINWSTNFL